MWQRVAAVISVDRWLILIVGAALLLVPLTIVSPLLSSLLVTACCAMGLLLRLAMRLHRLFLGFLGLCLVGYAFFGRGFAYLGVQPLFIGEIALLIGLAAWALRGGDRRLLHSPITVALAVFMLVGAAASVPHLGRYGLDVLRDGVVWGYAAFALLVGAFLLRTGIIARGLRAYMRWLPLFLAWAPIALMIRGFVNVPVVPGSNVEFITTKGGDTGVHLAGIFVFIALGMPRLIDPGARARTSLHEWLWWTLWAAGAAVVFTINRGGMVSIAAAASTLILLHPFARWAKLLTISLVLGGAFFASGIEIRHVSARPFSAASLMENIVSLIPGGEATATRQGTIDWRLAWWEDIVAYTIYGQYFWTGKGYGVNLAVDDGYVTGQNRNPHNGHMTILARSGVPGLLAWVVLLATVGLSLIGAYVRARRAGDVVWARIDLWLLCYWVAFIVNGSFDVFLEGPQGGIWFWSLIGLAIAILEMQRRGLPPPFAPPLGEQRS
jgi:hypothetical protein